MNITAHAKQRLQQRGLNANDLELIMMHGTETSDGYFLRRANIRVVEQTLKRLIDHLYRLEGKYIVVKGDNVITAYHPSKKKRKRVLRKAFQ
jgi:hypothetical protein